MILTTCGTTSTSTTEADESAVVDSSAETAQVEATEAPDEAPAEEQADAPDAVEETAMSAVSSPLVDTGQGICHNDDGEKIACPAEGEAFCSQDARFTRNPPSYTDNGDPSTGSGQAGIVTDNVTGLIWRQMPESETVSWDDPRRRAYRHRRHPDFWAEQIKARSRYIERMMAGIDLSISLLEGA